MATLLYTSIPLSAAVAACAIGGLKVAKDAPKVTLGIIKPKLPVLPVFKSKIAFDDLL